MDKVNGLWIVYFLTILLIFRFTFKSDGFYKTLQRKAAKILKETGTGPDWSSSIFQDFLTLSFLICFVYLCYYPLLTTAVITGEQRTKLSMKITLQIEGLFLGMSNNSSHNWFHLSDRKAKWRRFYFDLSLVGHREWRVSVLMTKC